MVSINVLIHRFYDDSEYLVSAKFQLRARYQITNRGRVKGGLPWSSHTAAQIPSLICTSIKDVRDYCTPWCFMSGTQRKKRQIWLQKQPSSVAMIWRVSSRRWHMRYVIQRLLSLEEICTAAHAGPMFDL